MRTAKQLCETAQPPSTISGQVGNYAFNQSVPPSGLFGADNAFQFNQQYLSQGCQASSLYSASAFQVPYGASLPYVIGAKVEGLLAEVDPYAETTQSTDLRQIQSELLPFLSRKERDGRIQRRLYALARTDLHIANGLQSRFPVVDRRLQSF